MKAISSSIYVKIFLLFLSAIVLAILLAYQMHKSLHDSEISRSKTEILYLIASITPDIVMGDFASAQVLKEQFGFFSIDKMPSDYTKLYESKDDMIHAVIFRTSEMIGFSLDYEEYDSIVARPISCIEQAENLFLIFFGLFAGILIMLSLMVLKLIYPLRKLKKLLKNFISESEFPTQTDEISALVLSFGNMSEQITRMLKSRELILKSLGHELRTPLTKMRLFVEVSQKEYPYMEKILPHISGLKHLIDNILELERLNSGKIQLESSRFFAETLVFETLTKFGEAEDKIQLEMKQNFSVQGDLELLARALRNLIENALKYNESPHIQIIIGDEICTHNTTIDNAKKNEMLCWGNVRPTPKRRYITDILANEFDKNAKPKCISVISKSPPLAHPLQYYTEPFVRDDTHSSLPGHGLGLSIVSDILALHGYSLQYRYDDGRHHFSMVFIPAPAGGGVGR